MKLGIKTIICIGTAGALLTLTGPAQSDVETTTEDGGQVLTGFAKIRLDDCRIRWDNSSNPNPPKKYMDDGVPVGYYLAGDCTPEYISTSSTNPMSLSFFSHDLNDRAYQEYVDGTLPDPNAALGGGNNDPDVMSGCWGLRMNIKTTGDIRPWLQGLGLDSKITRNSCTWHAQPMYTAGSGLATSGNANGSRGKNQDLTALVGSDGASVAIQFFSSNPLVGRWSRPSENEENRCVQIPPQFVAVSWKCVATPLPE